MAEIPDRDSDRTRAIRHTGGWFASRIVNAVLGLLQVGFTVRILGAEEAAPFFVFWTAAWLLAALLKFGSDGVLPRIVAETSVGRRPVESVRRLLLTGLATTLVVTPVLAAVLGVRASLVPIAFGLALTWGTAQILGSILTANSQPHIAGLITNVIWPVGPALAPLVLLTDAFPRAAVALSLVTLAAAAVGCVGAFALARKALARGAIASLISSSLPPLRVERDVVGAAVLSMSYELIVWLPVVLAAAARASALTTGAVFACVRLAGLVSWGYQAIVAVLTPRLAGALASRDFDRVRRLLFSASIGGFATTAPLAMLAALCSAPLLSVVDPTYRPAWVALVILVATRVVDGATGAVGEALLVGRRTWLDTGLVALGVGVSLATTLALRSNGIRATEIAAAAGVGWAVTNIARMIAVRRLLAAGWTGSLISRRALGLRLRTVARACSASGIVATGAIPALIVLVLHPSGSGAPWLAAATAFVGASWVAMLELRRSTRRAGVTPLFIVALVIAAEYGLRACTLAAQPGSATTGLLLLGFQPAHLAFVSAFGTAAAVALAAGFRLTSQRVTGAPQLLNHGLRPREKMGRRLAALLAFGTMLWIALFLRAGGPVAFVHDPASLHLNQFGGLYGLVGLLMCLGTALVLLWFRLHTPELRPRWITSVAVTLAILGSIVLASRGPLMATVVAAFGLVLQARRPRLRTVLVTCAVAFVALTGVLVAREVREYAQAQSISAAFDSTMHTPPLRFATSDLNEYDHFVGLYELVPSALPWLNGQSFANVPAVFVPRVLWPAKPLPVDFRLSQVLYGQGAAAGTPMTLAGEAYWNFGTAGGIAAMLALGAVFGLVWRAIGRLPVAPRQLLSALCFGYAYLLLTRPLGPMVLTTVAAAIGLCLAAFAAGLVQVPRRRLEALTSYLDLRGWITAVTDEIRRSPATASATVRAFGGGRVVPRDPLQPGEAAST